MIYCEAKVYFDGSHYVAIPHSARKPRRKPKPGNSADNAEAERTERGEQTEPVVQQLTFLTDGEPSIPCAQTPEQQTEQCADRPSAKALFESLYKDTAFLKRQERRKRIVEGMRPLFGTDEETELFVTENLERKRRNLIARRVRMFRKASLVGFNYFCTFTYDGKKHTETTFRKKLKNKLALLSHRKGWNYMGVFERSPEKNRLHFHGLFEIPQGTMPGKLIRKRDYSFLTHRMQTTNQNTYFNERFGRSDFEEIDEPDKIGLALAYLMKYIEKTGERIVYSKGLYPYFLADVSEEDVLCPFGAEDKKLLLFDDFLCIDNGEVMGTVCRDTIRKMRKTN